MNEIQKSNKRFSYDKTNARKDRYRLVENVNRYNEPTLIVGKKGNSVLLSEDDWNAIQETL